MSSKSFTGVLMKPVQRRNAAIISAIISALSSDGSFPRHADEEQQLQSSKNIVNKETHLHLLWPKYECPAENDGYAFLPFNISHLTCFETDKPTE